MSLLKCQKLASQEAVPPAFHSLLSRIHHRLMSGGELIFSQAPKGGPGLFRLGAPGHFIQTRVSQGRASQHASPPRPLAWCCAQSRALTAASCTISARDPRQRNQVAFPLPLPPHKVILALELQDPRPIFLCPQVLAEPLLTVR